ncbi:MAG: MFS transporter, partial [Candidatus Kapaibacterium sp.]
IANPEDYGKVSGYGFAMGYLGSFVILFIVLPILSKPVITEADTKLTFLIAGTFFAIASLPLFFMVKERATHEAVRGNLFTIGYTRLRETLSHLRRYDSIKKFLLAFFIYNDSILTVILFAGLFASETLKLKTESLIYFFMIVQGSALVGSLVFGGLTNWIGVRQSILITLGIWIAIVLGAAFWVTNAGQFFILGGVAGLALGSSQSCSRTMMALLTPPDKRTEFFGFYDGFFGKASAVIGPLIFGEVSQRFGQRPAMLILGVMFVIGMILMLRTPDVRAEREVEAG